MVNAISLWYLLQFKDNSMKCHLAMKLRFFLMISLNFCFLDFVTCSIQRNKFCMYVPFFHPIIAHYFARVKQIHLSYLFHFLTNCVPRAPKKKTLWAITFFSNFTHHFTVRLTALFYEIPWREECLLTVLITHYA